MNNFFRQKVKIASFDTLLKLNYSLFYTVYQATKRVQSNIYKLGKDGQTHENLLGPDGKIKERNNDMSSRGLFSRRNQFSPSKNFNMNPKNIQPSNGYMDEQVSSSTEDTNNFQAENVETTYNEGNHEISSQQIEQNKVQTGEYQDTSISTQYPQQTNDYMNEEASTESSNYNNLPSENVKAPYETVYSESQPNQEEQYHDNSENFQDTNGEYIQLNGNPQQGNNGSPSSVQYQIGNEKTLDSGTNIH